MLYYPLSMADSTPHPRLYFASDHAGFALKRVLMEYASTLGVAVEDIGPFELNPEDDYPDFVTLLAEKVAAEAGTRGVVIGASGQGEAMCANRVKGVRAGVFYGEPSRSQTDANGQSLGMVESMRAHNDANVLSLGARFVSEEEAREALRIFLETPFSGSARHLRRIGKF